MRSWQTGQRWRMGEGRPGSRSDELLMVDGRVERARCRRSPEHPPPLVRRKKALSSQGTRVEKGKKDI